MIEAPSFDNVKKHKELFPGVLCCIAFVPKFHKIGSLLSGENSPKQLLLINNQLVTKLIKFFD